MPQKPIVLAKPIGMVRTISVHAMERWMQRTNSRSESKSLLTLERQLSRAEQVQLAPQYQALALLNHGLEAARYLRFDTWIFVVSMDGTLLTVHAGEAKRWVDGSQRRSKKASHPRR